MPRPLVRFSWFLLLGVTLLAQPAVANPRFGAAPEPLAKRLADLDLAELADSDQAICLGQPLYRPDLIQEIYQARNGTPLWLPHGRPGRLAVRLMAILASSRQEGLYPLDYHYRALEVALTRAARFDPGALRAFPAELEILCTDAMLEYAWHQAGGRATPDQVWADWTTELPAEELLADFLEILSGLPAAERLDQLAWVNLFEKSLQGLRPQHEIYQQLIKALASVRKSEAAGGWIRIPEGPVLKPGQHDPRVRDVRFRLQQSGDWFPVHLLPFAGAVNGDTELYDSWLVAGVRRFQQRHGLRDDGIIGPATLGALNVSALQRRLQILANLERLRWLPRDLGRRHILVNIPEFRASLVEDGRTVMSMRAIIGRTDRPTPILSSELSCLVVNPAWHVPQKLAQRDLLPKIKLDPGILANRGFKVFSSWEAGAVELDPEQVDWQAVDPLDLSFKFVQVPGPGNPLGTVKFLFPNRYSVFLHDTNRPERFAEDDLCLSSGCVRLENPRALMGALLPPGILEAAAESASVPEPRERYLGIEGQVAVHLVYLTSWVGREGLLEFRSDVYGYDGVLLAGLARKPETQLVWRAAAENRGSGGGIITAAYQDLTGPVSR